MSMSFASALQIAAGPEALFVVDGSAAALSIGRHIDRGAGHVMLPPGSDARAAARAAVDIAAAERGRRVVALTGPRGLEAPEAEAALSGVDGLSLTLAVVGRAEPELSDWELCGRDIGAGYLRVVRPSDLGAPRAARAFAPGITALLDLCIDETEMENRS